jgi:hypothetical protein
VSTAEEAKGVRVERLNTQGKKADSEIPPGPNAFFGDILRVGLEKDPGALYDRKVFTG